MLPRIGSLPFKRMAASLKSGPASRFQMPKLDDVDLVSVGRDKLFSKISGKPARLQLQLARNSLRRKQRPLTHTRGYAHFRVAIDRNHFVRVCSVMFEEGRFPNRPGG